MRDWIERTSWTTIFMWVIGTIFLFFILFGSVRSLAAGRYPVGVWLDFVVFGIAQGSIYALIALGYTMVYGILRMINFAHGEVFMSGAFT
ncbi:MAG: ABC transporter permease subunit, partial [Ardenticatenaceae bacterium]